MYRARRGDPRVLRGERSRRAGPGFNFHVHSFLAPLRQARGGGSRRLRARGVGPNLPCMAYFLFKTEPDEYSFTDLLRDKRTTWDGIANALALKHLRTVAKGDSVVIYHTGDERRAVGLATVTRGAYSDPEYQDVRLAVVDLKPERAFDSPVPLAAFKEDAVLKDTELVRITRLSVMPLTPAQYERVLALANGGA